MWSFDNQSNSSLHGLIAQLSKIPGLGGRSAKRMVYHLLSQQDQSLNHLIEKLSYIRDHAKHCTACHTICFSELCEICTSPHRDNTILCLVEKPQNIDAIEKSGAYRGLYHVTGGVLSAFNGITPDDLHINSLKKRLTDLPIQEIIFALPATQDGRTTLYYITDMLGHIDVKMTLPAQGMPLGSDLEYLDQGTLMTAFHARKSL